MPEKTSTPDEIFPKGTSKTYALVEMVRGKGPMVGKGPDDTIFSFPLVILWETILTLGVTLSIFVFSLFKQAPLEEIADPLLTTDPAKAPWYFVGLQEMLEHMHPTLAGVIIPGILVLFLILLPYIDHSREGVGKWFSSTRGKRIVFWTALYTLLTMTSYIVLDNLFSLRELLRDLTPIWVAQGLVPGSILLLLVFFPTVVLRLKKASVREIMLCLFTVMLFAAVVFTVSGFFFRGPGFQLYFPWEMPNGYNPWNDF